MGMNAQLIGIGPYSPEIVSALNYPAKYYEAVAIGMTIVTEMVEMPGSSMSRALAEALGFDAWDFSRHHISLDRVDYQKLRELFKWNESKVQDFIILVQAGFDFYFLPNG